MITAPPCEGKGVLLHTNEYIYILLDRVVTRVLLLKFDAERVLFQFVQIGRYASYTGMNSSCKKLS